MKFISLFAGIGGFDLALTRQGHTCVYANEWDKYAAQIYDKNFGHKPDTRDITTIPDSDIPAHDLLVGGFPCQAFSIAGKRRGFDDTRGTLFFEIARILREKHPRLFLLENVKGLLSHDNGNTFKTIISTLDELGYDLQWQVLNSKNFGVPQNRERVFVVGHLRGTSRPEVFPIRGKFEKDQRELALTLMARDYKGVGNQKMTLVEKNTGASQGYRVYDPSGISTTLAGEAGGIGAKTGLYAMQWRRTEKGKEIRRENQKQGMDYTPFSNGCREVVPNAQAIAKDSLLGNESQIRRLTPTECERLQGFPDGFTEGISDTQRYKCLGNAVTVNVVEYIIKHL
jgi:DNA (cytosine-5)-methyltransferase 1